MSILYIDGLEEIGNKYHTYIVDLWGVIHDGATPYPHVKECLTALKNKGKKVYFLSNSPRRAHIVAAQLDTLGIQESLYDGLHTSGEDAYFTISEKKDPFYEPLTSTAYALSLRMHSQLFEDLKLTLVDQIEEASFLMNTGPSISYVHDFDPLLEKASQLGLPMVCVNPDISVISGGKPTLCAGSLAERYKALGGVVKYHGKPYPEIYNTLLKKWNVTETEKVLAIGDSLATDIKGANTVGIDSGLVMTGLAGQEFGFTEKARERIDYSSRHKEVYPTYVLPGFKI